MKSPLSFKPTELLEYHQHQLKFMKQDLRNKVARGQMKDTYATKLIAMQEYTVKMVKENQPVRQLNLGEQTKP
jgi:hypothetical protein